MRVAQKTFLGPRCIMIAIEKKIGPRSWEVARGLCDRGLLDEQDLAEPGVVFAMQRDATELVHVLVSAGKLTPYQAEGICQSEWDSLVIGNYVVLAKIGSGAMGAVYKAQHRKLKRLAALKVLGREVSRSTIFVRRFHREVESLAKLNHPNVVMVYDADESKIGHFVAMEYVDGRDLDQVVRLSGPLPIGEAISAIRQAAAGLSFAHAHGVIHRDVKPANLLRDGTGLLKIADLGLARLAAESRMAQHSLALTESNGSLGTAAFMAPEQASDPHADDPRADVYSLGCTLFYLLVGRPPYAANSQMGMLIAHRDHHLPNLCELRPDVPVNLQEVFQQMVAKRRTDRLSDMNAVIAAIESVAAANLASPGKPLSGERAVVVPKSAPNSVTGRYSGKSVLIVEPNRSQVNLLQEYLSLLGMPAVRMADSGARAMELIQVAAPSVLIAAPQLPDMSGTDLALAIWAAGKTNVGVILTTNDGPSHAPSRSGEGGRLEILSRPIDVSRLDIALQRIIA